MEDQGGAGFFSPFPRRKRFEAATHWLQGMVFDFGCGSGVKAESVPHERNIGFDQEVL